MRLAGVGKCYGPVRAVGGLDLRIAAGEVVALLAPNGAGKSTTIDMMLGLVVPDSGTARLFGLAPGDATRRGAVGAMLQSGELLPHVTVREILGLVAATHEHPLSVDAALDRAGIADLGRRRTNKLSGGQDQRVRACSSCTWSWACSSCTWSSVRRSATRLGSAQPDGQMTTVLCGDAPRARAVSRPAPTRA